MRYSGKFGFATSTETAPGVWEDVITERNYLGDVLQRTERFTEASEVLTEGSVLPAYRTSTSVSVLSDGVLREKYNDLRYIVYRGNRWVVQSIIHKYPRVEIYMGGVYNGPTPN